MTENAKVFDRIVEERRSMRIYDQEAPFDSSAVKRSIERATLAPSSSNMQLWEFYQVRSKEVLKKLSQACLNQSAARTAREMVVIVVRRDKWKERRNFNLKKVEELVGSNPEGKEKLIVDYYKKLIPFVYTHDPLGILGIGKQIAATLMGFFREIPRSNTRADARIGAHKSAALAAMTFMYSIKAEGYDTCPMEGFDSKLVRKTLKLPMAAEINMIISVGPGTKEGIYNSRWRIDNQNVIFER